MLSYRHAFHAGNHADILKHLVLRESLAYMVQKDKPLWVIDTHAGAGSYSLQSKYAAQNAEFETGISKLWELKNLSIALAALIETIAGFNPGGALKTYPGSPMIARTLLRADDRMRLYELHSADHLALEQKFKGDNAVRISKSDGFAGLKASLPPQHKRALTLIDPSYERREDYRDVITALTDAHTRFPTGVYLLWYPLLQKREAIALPEKLRRLPFSHWLDVTLTVQKPAIDGFGMHGSGMFVINPPWVLAETLKACMPVLVSVLGLDRGAYFTLEQQGK